MNSRLKFIVVLMIALSSMTMPLQHLYAQPKSIGTSYSLTGFSISYEHSLKKYDSFLEFSIKAETSEMFLYRANVPGFSSSLIWNFPIKRWLSKECTALTLIAGPGIACGYAKDFKVKDGFFFGLKGRFGIECAFSRNVILSTFISPIIGSHVEVLSEYVTMNYYKNGVLMGLVPEVAIRYVF